MNKLLKILTLIIFLSTLSCSNKVDLGCDCNKTSKVSIHELISVLNSLNNNEYFGQKIDLESDSLFVIKSWLISVKVNDLDLYRAKYWMVENSDMSFIYISIPTIEDQDLVRVKSKTGMVIKEDHIGFDVAERDFIKYKEILCKLLCKSTTL